MSLLRCISKSYLHHTNITKFRISSRYIQSRNTLRHHYATLNVDANTSIDDIKKTYNELVKKWHPDVHSSKSEPQQKEAHKQFLLIREAYEAIINNKQNLNNVQTVDNVNGKRPEHNYGHERIKWQHQRYYHHAWDNTNNKIYDDDVEDDENGERTWIWYLTEANWIRFCVISIITYGLLKYTYSSDINKKHLEHGKYTTRPAYRGRYMIYKGQRYPLEPLANSTHKPSNSTSKT
eukprot:46469_1